MFSLLKVVKKLVRKNKLTYSPVQNLESFTHETRQLIDKFFFEDNFNPGVIFAC